MEPEVVINVLSKRVYTEKHVEHVVVGNDIVIYRVTTTTTVNRRKRKPVIAEGITSTAGLKAFLKGAETMPYYSKERGAVFADASFLEFLRTNGWLGDEVYKRFQEVTKEPYTLFMEGKVTLDNLVFIEGGAHMVFDREGQPLPVAILFNYIDAHMDNGHYDLKRALQILKARDDIRFVQENQWTPADQVARIPGYNAEPGRDHCIAFVWMPKVEDYRRMWAKCQEYGDRHHPSCERYRAVFDLDLLGLRAGGAAKFSDFYARVPDPPERSFDDEEDED